MKAYLLLYILLFNTAGLTAQIKNELKIAEELFKNEKYSDAVHYFLRLIKKDSLNSNLNFKTGICYLNSRSQKYKATGYLERAIKYNDPRSLPAHVYEQLGDGYHLNQQFDKAIYAYKQYKAILSGKGNNNAAAIAAIDWKIEMCGVCKKISIDTSLYSNYTSLFSAEKNELTLTFYKEAIDENQPFFQDFYNTAALPASISADTSQYIQNEATIGTSLDAHNILIYRNEGGTCNLYTSNLESNQWSFPLKLDKKINKNGWESGEFISADNTTMYFTSDRKGGFGGKDIYLCKKLASGNWGPAINMGPTINSAYDDEAPFIHPNGKTFYFSSNRYTHSSSFDIFNSNYSEEGSWTFPVNVGYPSERKNDNSAADATYIPEKKNKGLITFVDDNNNKLTVLFGYAIDLHGRSPENITVTVEEKETGSISGTYKATSDFCFLLAEYDITVIYEAQGYLYITENIELSKNNIPAANKIKSLIPISPGVIVELKNIFFEHGRTKILQSSGKELDRLIKLLSAEQNIVIELSGYVNAESDKKYYERLSENRVQAVIEYLISKGISKERLILKTYEKPPISGQKETTFAESGIFSIDQKIELKILETDSKKNNSLTTQ